MRVVLGGLQKATLQDFPDKIACIVFTKGCNFKCGYCHNPELFSQETPTLSLSEFFDFLKTRQNKLDGVVITGGEPTLHKDLDDFIIKIKEMGFAVKLDTNGTNFDMLESLVNKGFVDYVAMDIKAPLDKYSKITNVDFDINVIQKSIELLLKNKVDYEFRTTVVKSQLNFEDFEKIGKLISGAKKYYLQKFEASKILDDKLCACTTYSDLEFQPILAKLRQFIPCVEIR